MEEKRVCVWNEEKEEVEGRESLEVWRKSFEELGKENLEDEKFDKKFLKKIMTEVERETKEINELKLKDSELDDPLTEDEVSYCVRELQLGKTGGGEEMSRSIYQLCVKVWEREEIPELWSKGIIFPIFKDGERKDTQNYRGITLLSIVGKVYTFVLNKRLTGWSETT